jgi:hypothetical protein
MPSGRNALVGTSGVCAMSRCPRGAVMTAPNPKPATAMPVMSPGLSGNHFCSMAIGTMYAIPSPNPPSTPYPSTSSQNELAVENDASSTPMLYRTPPVSATTRGPRRSWMRPPMKLPRKIIPMATSKGTVAWAFDQPNAWSLVSALENTLQA